MAKIMHRAWIYETVAVSAKQHPTMGMLTQT